MDRHFSNLKANQDFNMTGHRPHHQDYNDTSCVESNHFSFPTKVDRHHHNNCPMNSEI